SAPFGSLGTVAILGNHDYGKYSKQPEVGSLVTTTLRKLGFPVLRNEQCELGGLVFTGLDDMRGPNFNPYPVVKTIDQSKANIVLCHNPDIADIPIWEGYSSWILSGHTHGGQVRLPYMRPPLLPVKNKAYDRGVFHLENGHHLYVNRGVGHLTKLRLNVRPEITIHTLDVA
ncbi:MAG: phosphoesterase, partial [Chloroflexota bacterium]